jgi:hypothetical protein
VDPAAVGHAIRQILAIDDALACNEEIDMEPKTPAFVTQIERDPGSQLFEPIDDITRAPGLKRNLLPLKLWEKGKQVLRQLDGNHCRRADLNPRAPECHADAFRSDFKARGKHQNGRLD